MKKMNEIWNSLSKKGKLFAAALVVIAVWIVVTQVF
jgi:flagellar biosynthesis/type III secretory pathway M-ring protein FliF/YscJ